MRPILLILTGGTICSFADSNNINRDVDMDKAKSLIEKGFKNSDSIYTEQIFETKVILNTLSENMTVPKWQELLDYIDTVDFDKYAGVIIAHGTDTLAYTAALMALRFEGMDVPVFLVSSALPLSDKKANGNANFRVAVELINEKIDSGVYVPYRNSDGNMYIHFAEEIKQCAPYSEDFFSQNMYITQTDIASIKQTVYNLKNTKINIEKNKKFSSKKHLLNGIKIKDKVVLIKPYVGLNYELIKIEEGVKAVVHELYHSSTACVEVTAGNDKYGVNSILYLIDKCNKHDIPVIVTPCPEEDNIYVSSGYMKDKGALPVYGLTTEMVYVKTIVAIALGYKGKEIINYIVGL